MDQPERYEQLLAFLGSQLPAPVEQQEERDGAIQFLSGEPPEVVVRLTDGSVVVSEFAGIWETPFRFVKQPRRVGVLKWRRLPEGALWDALTALIKGAREARRSRFQICQYCGANTPPEWQHDDRVCRSCAERHHGMIH